LSVGAVQIDGAVACAVLAALAPAGLEAALAAAERLEADREDALAQWQLAAERARYEAQRAERRYRAVDAENRLVARGLESEWEQRLRELEQTKAELARREREPAGFPIAWIPSGKTSASGSRTAEIVRGRGDDDAGLVPVPWPDEGVFENETCLSAVSPD
jgi:hypothetical protein